jgi:hypothetical protein
MRLTFSLLTVNYELSKEDFTSMYNQHLGYDRDEVIAQQSGRILIQRGQDNKKE